MAVQNNSDYLANLTGRAYSAPAIVIVPKVQVRVHSQTCLALSTCVAGRAYTSVTWRARAITYTTRAALPGASHPDEIGLADLSGYFTLYKRLCK